MWHHYCHSCMQIMKASAIHGSSGSLREGAIVHSQIENLLKVIIAYYDLRLYPYVISYLIFYSVTVISLSIFWFLFSSHYGFYFFHFFHLSFFSFFLFLSDFFVCLHSFVCVYLPPCSSIPLWSVAYLSKTFLLIAYTLASLSVSLFPY